MPNTSSASEPIAMPTAMAITMSSDGSFDDTIRKSTSSPTQGHSTRRHWCDSQGVATMTRATAEAISGEVGNDVDVSSTMRSVSGSMPATMPWSARNWVSSCMTDRGADRRR